MSKEVHIGRDHIAVPREELRHLPVVGRDSFVILQGHSHSAIDVQRHIGRSGQHADSLCIRASPAQLADAYEKSKECHPHEPS